MLNIFGSKKHRNPYNGHSKMESSDDSARRRDDGIIVVGGRIPKSAESSYDEQELTLMPYTHRLSRLYAERLHNRGHAGVSATVSKIRARFWILNLRRMVRAIKHQCVIC